MFPLEPKQFKSQVDLENCCIAKHKTVKQQKSLKIIFLNMEEIMRDQMNKFLGKNL